jgi:S1-C subfamily serine protease
MSSELEAFHQSEGMPSARANIPLPDELSSAIGRVRPALPGIGRIETKQLAQVNNQIAQVQSEGSGFVIDKNTQGCLIFTKEHVVHDLHYGAMKDGNGTIAGPTAGSQEPEVVVTMPELGPRKAKVLLADESTDSAILQIGSANPDKECKVVPMAQSTQDVRSNDLSIVVGYDGKSGQLNGLTGIVGGTTNISAIEQAGSPMASSYVYPKFVKTQNLLAIYGAAAPEGYSGGPTFNARGEVIGASHAQVGTGTLVTPIEIVRAELRRVQK